MVIKPKTIGKLKKDILDVIKNNENIPTSRIGTKLSKNYDVIKPLVEELEKENKIEKLPNTKLWRLKK